MAKINLPVVSGLLLILLGLTVCTAWILHVPQLINILPQGNNMAFNSALCFVLSGFFLAFSYKQTPKFQQNLSLILGSLLVVTSALTLFEDLTGYALGIDEFFVKSWLVDSRPFPGRMSNSTSAMFLIVGFISLLMPYTSKKSLATAVQILIFASFLVWITAILGYWNKLSFLENLYPWYKLNRISIHTTVGLFILIIGYASLWRQQKNSYQLLQANEDKKILLLCSKILFCIVYIAGVAGLQDESVRELLLILLSSMSGMLIIYWLVKPSIRRLIHSELQASQHKSTLDEKESYIRAVLDKIAEGITTIDEQGIIISFNQKAEIIFGYAASEIIGQPINILIPEHLHAAHEQKFSTGASTIINKPSFELLGLRKNGEQFPLELSIAELYHNQQRLFTGIMRDITMRKNMEAALMASEKRFHAAFDYAAVGIAIIGLDGRFFKINSAMAKITGYIESELLDTNFQSLTYHEDLEQDLNNIKQLLNGEIDSYQIEKRCYHKKGHLIWILKSCSLVRDETGQPSYFIGQIQDLSKQKESEELLKYQAHHDLLTGLPNRISLEENIKKAIIDSQHSNHIVAILFIDIDHFKDVNDNLGHDSGDLLLKSIAKILKSNIRETDYISRLGGDEFIVMLTGINHYDTISTLVERIKKSITEYPFKLKNHEINISISIGISLYPTHGQDIYMLLKKADIALYKAKNLGRNNYQCYDATTDDSMNISSY